MNYNEKKSIYLEKNPTWHIEDSPWKANQILKLLNRNNLHFKTICEVGCGVGEILIQLNNKMPGIDYVGYEIAPDAYELASRLEKENIKFVNKDFFLTREIYDLLLVIDVIEHVKDFYGFLDGLKGRATYKIFHFPIDMTIYSLVRKNIMRDREKLGHIHYFSKDTILASLRDSGYQVFDWYYTPGIEVNRSTFKQRVLNIFRKFFFKLNKDLTVQYLSGYSLIVLAK